MTRFLIIILFILTIQPARADVTDGLVGWWKLDEGSGTTANDSSGQGNTGTLTNGPTWTSGKRDGSINFDGNNDYITVPDTSILEMSFPFSVSAWINTTTVNNTVILEKDSNSGYSFQTFSGVNAGKVLLNVGGTGAGDRITSSTLGLNNDGLWHHVVFVVTSVSGAVYIDARNDTNEASHGSPTYGTGTFYMGGRGVVAPFPGLLDDVRIYSRALTQAEVSAIYLAGTPRLSVKGGGKISGMKQK